MNRIEHEYNGGIRVHYDSAIGDTSAALCGQDVIRDSVVGAVWGEGRPSCRRVNCPDCIAIVRHVRGRSNATLHLPTEAQRKEVR